MKQKTLNIGSSKEIFTLDNGNTVELDPCDPNILARFYDIKEQIAELKFEAISSGTTNNLEEIAIIIKDLDTKMRQIIDYLFDSPVAIACCGNTSMFAIYNGVFKFEKVISGLFAAYEDNIKLEAEKINKRISAKKEVLNNV